MTENTGYRPRAETRQHLRPNKPRDPLVEVAPFSPHAKPKKGKPGIRNRIKRRAGILAAVTAVGLGLNVATGGGVEDTLQGVKEGFVQAITGKEQIEPYSDRVFDVEFREFPTGELNENGYPINVKIVFRSEPNEDRGKIYGYEELIRQDYDFSDVKMKLVKGSTYNEGKNTPEETNAEKDRAQNWGILEYNDLKETNEEFGVWGRFEASNGKDTITVFSSLNFAVNKGEPLPPK